MSVFEVIVSKFINQIWSPSYFQNKVSLCQNACEWQNKVASQWRPLDSFLRKDGGIVRRRNGQSGNHNFSLGDEMLLNELRHHFLEIWEKLDGKKYLLITNFAASWHTAPNWNRTRRAEGLPSCRCQRWLYKKGSHQFRSEVWEGQILTFFSASFEPFLSFLAAGQKNKSEQLSRARKKEEKNML